MKVYHQILLSAIIFFLMMFLGIWIFNHVHAWFGVFTILLAIYIAIRLIVRIINKLNKNENEK